MAAAEEEALTGDGSEEKEDDVEDDPFLMFGPGYHRDSIATDETREVVQRFLVTKERSTFSSSARTKYLEVLVDGSVRVKDPKEARPDGLIQEPLRFFSGKAYKGPKVAVRYAGKKRNYKFSTTKDKKEFFEQLSRLKTAKATATAKSPKYATEAFAFVPDEVEAFFIQNTVISRVGSSNSYSHKLVAITNYRMVVVETLGRSIVQSSIKNGDLIISALSVEHASVVEFEIDGDTVTLTTNDLRELCVDLSAIDTSLLKTQSLNILKAHMQPLMDARDIFAFSGFYQQLRAMKLKGPRTPLSGTGEPGASEPTTLTLATASAAAIPLVTPKHAKSGTGKFSRLARMVPGSGKAAPASATDEDEDAVESKKDKPKVAIERVDEDVTGELLAKLCGRVTKRQKRAAMIEEYKRLGFREADADCKYRISCVNEDYGLCTSYPPLLLVPAEADDELIRKAARHRSANRLTAITWANRFDVTMSRCSQPLAGLGSTKKSNEDEQMIELLNEMNGNSTSFFICDCRPKKNAMANAMFLGKGFEGDSYAHSHIVFFDIENIHVMRNSVAAVKKCCEDQHNPNWLTSLSASGYLQHLSKILQCANRVANLIDSDKISVLVHCSDGWDRTAQVCALSQVLLDAHYRKFSGFLTLVQKEWLWFGHKFADRNGNFGLYGVPRTRPKERSPIFLQFLDCVFQAMHQYPWAFEFTADLLLEFAKHVSSARFGDFLCNCEKERDEMELWMQTPSLCRYLQRRWDGAVAGGGGVLSNFHNVSYVPTQRVLKPRPYVRDLLFWDELHCRFTAHDKDRRVIRSAKTSLARYLSAAASHTVARSAAVSVSLSSSTVATLPHSRGLRSLKSTERLAPPSSGAKKADAEVREHSSSEELEDGSRTEARSSDEVIRELTLKLQRLEQLLADCKCSRPMAEELAAASPSASGDDDFYQMPIGSVV